MLRRLAGCCVRTALLLLLGLNGVTVAQEVKADPQAEAVDLDAADWKAIRESVESYAAAFNAGDAETLAELYADDAELVDVAGNVFQGRETIQKEFAAFYQRHPQARIKIFVDAIRSVAPGIIMEDGRTETQLGEKGEVVTSRYVAVHGKQNDGWQLMSVRDIQSQSDEPGRKLESLAWMIGRWIDEDVDSVVEIDCFWDKSGAYLIREFKERSDGVLASSGTERIGWDPLRMQVRSWMFDSKGGYLEAQWTCSGDTLTVVAHGYRADGKPLREIFRCTRLREDAFHIGSSDRFVGETQLEDLDMTIVRRPPPAAPIETNSEASESSTSP